MHDHELIDLIGSDDAVALSNKLGGEMVYIPHERPLADEHPLIRAVGRDIVDSLQAQYRGERIYVPAYLATEYRNQQLIADYLNGTSTQDLAIRYGITCRRIRQITNPHRADRSTDAA